ncbi:MAG: CoA pyrophosphatase [Polaromonas sp. 39-63-203]|jgi:8-oxo-dGTP pyrophosphatase MutT (NUDIX family)|uniref:CoA pyrophosphatase n=1 Tax=Polaromonas sp. TaxID=1869339 RepID=UPI000BD38603|nr:CoA pyrophosphatase [Polaromonas sp.]OYY52286.1 MAG: CoA pyrophosphatase [Polaromonas sp. 35-63-240]OYY96203.1 MAG: CoA pyrophosphatase [Polaromonas sp. 28-63-22]OYZ83563.1 MAG: CoA pyrophosphatase [Polaromonas sp. 24-62-144]OZA98356.1 MAG: CoA pyrophosphatase [Polaromonas sp. 39-63-203]HQS31463.1 CoA pyrophosphatase [Polaromonas sp.]
MKFTRPLPKFDPRSVPVVGIDDHLAGVAARHLTPDALRARFLHPPAWVPEHSVEKMFADREPAAAAVLVPLVMRDELTLILTLRTANLSTHSGQVAFPGGRTDSTDRDATDTALREAEEEIGLPRDHVEVLGQLPIYVTGTAFIITPVVALVTPGFALRPNPGEVADVFEVPLSYLMNPANHRRHEFEFDGVTRQWLSMPYVERGTEPDAGLSVERYIWGATAGMLRNLYRFLSA